MWTPSHATRAALMRQRRGRHPRPKTVPQKPWTMPEIRLLGTMRDADLAAKLGRTRTAVAGARLNRGIPAWRKPQPRYERPYNPTPCPLAWAVSTWGGR